MMEKFYIENVDTSEGIKYDINVNICKILDS
jgi:hypothetical protein